MSFHLVCSFLCCAKAFKFNSVPFVCFCFYFHYCRRWFIEELPWFMSSSVLPMFYSKSFIVTGLPFRSLIHFDFILVYGIRKCSNFILLHIAVLFFQHHLLKRLSLPYCMSLLPLSKIRYGRCVGLSLGSLSCFIGLYFCFCASTILSWWLYLCSIVWSYERWFLQLPSFSRLLWLFGVFYVSIWTMKFFGVVLWKMPLVIW